MTMLEAWLHHGGRTPSNLGIHRNTPAYRLRCALSQLGLNVDGRLASGIDRAACVGSTMVAPAHTSLWCDATEVAPALVRSQGRVGSGGGGTGHIRTRVAKASAPSFRAARQRLMGNSIAQADLWLAMSIHEVTAIDHSKTSGMK